MVRARREIETNQNLIQEINREHNQVVEAIDDALAHAWQAGKLPNQMKQRIPHGGWRQWLDKHFSGSATTAQEYVKIYKTWSDKEQLSSATTGLSYTQARQLTRSPRTSQGQTSESEHQQIQEAPNQSEESADRSENQPELLDSQAAPDSNTESEKLSDSILPVPQGHVSDPADDDPEGREPDESTAAEPEMVPDAITRPAAEIPESAWEMGTRALCDLRSAFDLVARTDLPQQLLTVLENVLAAGCGRDVAEAVEEVAQTSLQVAQRAFEALGDVEKAARCEQLLGTQAVHADAESNPVTDNQATVQDDNQKGLPDSQHDTDSTIHQEQDNSDNGRSKSDNIEHPTDEFDVRRAIAIARAKERRPDLAMRSWDTAGIIRDKRDTGAIAAAFTKTGCLIKTGGSDNPKKSPTDSTHQKQASEDSGDTGAVDEHDGNSQTENTGAVQQAVYDAGAGNFRPPMGQQPEWAKDLGALRRQRDTERREQQRRRREERKRRRE